MTREKKFTNLRMFGTIIAIFRFLLIQKVFSLVLFFCGGGEMLQLKTIIAQANKIRGWRGDQQMLWLANNVFRLEEMLGRGLVIIEVGPWMGKTTKLLSGVCTGVVYVVDHWLGSDSIGENRDATGPIAREMGRDAVYAVFCRNLADEIRCGKVVPIRSASVNAVPILDVYLQGGKADMIFIDADHSYRAVVADLATYMPLLADYGLICGDDYVDGWDGVIQAVNERFGKRNARKGPGALWYWTKTGEIR